MKVRLADADPAAFLMVLDYIYTDQIDPTRGHREKHASNEVVLSMMQVLALILTFDVCNCPLLKHSRAEYLVIEGKDTSVVILLTSPLLLQVYMLAVQFHMSRLEQLCISYLESSVNHKNVLVALKNASQLKLFFIKEFCLKFIIKETSYNQIVMSKEFETLDQHLMVEIIRRKQVRVAQELVYYLYHHYST